MSLLKIRNPQAGVPNDYSFTVPETGYRVGPSYTLVDLFKDVERHYTANNIPLPPDWKEKVEDMLCKSIPPDFCFYQGAGGPRSDMTGEAILKGLASLSFLMSEVVGGKDIFVEQQEANKRAEICSRCYLNMPSNFCGGCAIGQAITNAVAKVKGGRSTPHDNALKNCGVCGCKNEAIVHINKNILLKGEKTETTNSRPDWCWLKTSTIQESKENLHL
jgi:hypothetical protein